MKTLHILLIMVILPLWAMAQTASSNLQIFSQDGDSFYVFLNGQQQNTEPVSSINLSDLQNSGYQIKIVFTNNSLAPIERRLTTPKGYNFVYTIVRGNAQLVRLNELLGEPIDEDEINTEKRTLRFVSRDRIEKQRNQFKAL